MLSALLAFAALPQAAPDPGVSSTIKKIYVVEMSHTDVGFTDPPTVVAQEVHDNLVEALRLADLRSEFRWTLETGFQLEQFDRLASAADKARLKNRFAQRRFVLGAGYVGPHSGIWTEELLNRFAHPSGQLALEYGARMNAALLDDVPGYTLAMPRALARSGVEYLLLGPNDFVGGKPAIPLGDTPFWWQGRDGSRVLAWQTYDSYIEGFFAWGFNNVNQAYNKLSTILPEYEAAGYPYDALLVMRGADNTAPSLTMANLARDWNARYDNPKFVLATPDEFFEHLLQSYGDVFPVYEGDAAGLWENGSQVTPATQSSLRRRLAALPDVEALQTISHAAGGRSYPFGALQQAWRGCMLYLEHSGGGGGWPGLMTLAEVNQQNEEFVALTQAVEDRVDGLRARGLKHLGPLQVPAGEGGLVAFNPLGGDYDGVLEVDCGGPQPADLAVVDPETGASLPFRWTAADRSALAFRAAIPANGWRRWQLGSGGSAPAPPAWNPGATLQAGGKSLQLDPATGVALSLVDAAGGEWIDGASAHRFGGVEHAYHMAVFWGVFHPFQPSPVTVLVEDPGPVYQRARVYGPSGVLLQEYRLHEHQDLLEVIGTVHRDRLPFVPLDKHSEHFAMTFPFALQTPTALRADGPGGFYTPGVDSLPGAAARAIPLATGAVLTGAGGRWASIVPRDSPLLHLGEMEGAPGADPETDENALTTKMVQHIDQTEVIGGAIRDFPDEPGMPNEVPQHSLLRFGEAGIEPPGRGQLRHDFAPPLTAWVEAGAATTPQPPSGRYFRLIGEVRAVAFKRTEADDGYLLRLRASPDARVAALLRLPWNPREAWSADLLERPELSLVVQGDQVVVPVTPNETITVLLPD